MCDAEEAQRPRERQQQVEERAGVEAECVPLSKIGRAAVHVGIPQREEVAAPEALAVEVGKGVAEEPVVAIKERLPVEEHAPKGDGEERGEHERETTWREPSVRRAAVWRLGSGVWGGRFGSHDDFGLWT